MKIHVDEIYRRTLPDGSTSLTFNLDTPSLIDALVGWVDLLGLDAHQMPASFPVVVDGTWRVVTARYFTADADGRPLNGGTGQLVTHEHVVHLDGPAPPLPPALEATVQRPACPTCLRPYEPTPTEKENHA